MAWKPSAGEVVPYSFLWAHESALGEESGRKLRPCGTAGKNSFGFLPPVLLKKLRAAIGVAQRRGGLLSTNRDA